MQSELVVKSNDVIEASYRLTLSEQRLILMCIQKIKKGEVVSATDSFDIAAEEFADLFEISPKRAYTELQSVTDKLYERSVTVHNPDPDEPTVAVTKTRWITAIDYIPKEGRVRMMFAQKMIPYISMLEGGFTRYNLEYVSGMSSSYGIRFYEFFKCWLFGSSRKTKKISLDDLKETLELTGKYATFKDFRRKVLDRAIQDVNEHSDLRASYKSLKTGRRITHIQFDFHVRKKPQKALAVGKGNGQAVKVDRAYIERHARPGESYEEAGRRLLAELKKGD